VLSGGLLLAALLIGDPLDIGSIIAAMALVVLAWSIGSQVRQRRLRSEDRIQRRLAEDRIEIARELHDVVAHGMSVMVVQAGAARTVLRADPDAAESAIKTVEDTGRDSLAEMRRILGVLRGSSDEGGELAPQPGMGDLPDLIEASRSAGVSAALSIDGDPRPVGSAVGLSAFRITQEALTNVRRHAGPDANAEVHLRYLPDRVEVEVSDDGLGPNGQVPGHGLVGMRERAESLGGELTAGPSPEGGFVVRAVLPERGPS
jgi:signal transduction histidine kinase